MGAGVFAGRGTERGGVVPWRRRAQPAPTRSSTASTVAVYLEDRLNEDGQVEFKGKAKVFCRTYHLLSSVILNTATRVGEAFDPSHFVALDPRRRREEDAAKGILRGDGHAMRVEKKDGDELALSDADAEIQPVPTNAGGARPAPELDALSNILKTFNEHFGTFYRRRTPHREAQSRNEHRAQGRRQCDVPECSDEHAGTPARLAHDQALGKEMQKLLRDIPRSTNSWLESSFRRLVGDMVYEITRQG